jgi:NAD(P)-dependent dehydrogenase (short-subunit alcohol dehydrogenase family)
MQVEGSVVVVTGAGNGLGRALSRRFAELGAAGVVAVDLDGDAAATVAGEVDGIPVVGDVGTEQNVRRAVEAAEDAHSRVDIFVSNAGVIANGDPFTPDDTWQRAWQVNVMSNVYAARAVLPGMLARGRGHLACTASSTGMTTSTGDLPYAATKHAQVAIAEWLAMVYGTRGIGVTCFCPRWMWTDMTRRAVADPALVSPALALAQVGGVTAEEAAERFVAGIEDDRFLVLTYDDVLADFRARADDFGAWIRRLQEWHDVLQPDVGGTTQ